MANRDAVPGLSDLIRSAREKAGLTQGEVQAAVGVHSVTLSQYESGRKTPGIAVLRRLARAYGVSPCDLIPALEDSATLPETIAKPQRGRPRKAEAAADPVKKLKGKKK